VGARVSDKTVAGSYLDSLNDRGIRHVFANAGTDFAPIIEAIVQAREAGRSIPRFVTVPHENVAVSMAHGYYRISGAPAAVMVHVTVGTANAVCGIMNAARDNVPLLLAAGRTPNTETGYAGSRDVWIHWGQDSFDQGGMLREFVKWDYELRAGQPVDDIVGRALDIAMSEPRGPVYLTLPREVLDQKAAAGPYRRRARPPGAQPAAPAADAIERAAAAINNAEFPVLVTSTLGRDPDNVELLARLAELRAIAVIQSSARDVNIPSNHPLNLGARDDAALRRADVILNIDCEVPWFPKHQQPNPDACLIHFAPDPLYARYPYRGFAMDIAIAGSTRLALRQLLDALASGGKPNQKRTARRRREIAGMHLARMDRQRGFLKKAAAMRPIHPLWVAECVNRVKRKDTIIVDEMGVAMDYLELNEPRSYITSSLAGGLGMGLGAALGASLAAGPRRDVILLVGDGAYMFGNPTPAHLVAAAERLPTLTVILNNGRWQAVQGSTIGMYPQGRAAKSGKMPLVELQPSPRFDQIMQACGGHGERVEDPRKLVAALERALAAVAGGTPALVNVITRPR
jgi:acetolactate synthase-1/2/3 large subunit